MSLLEEAKKTPRGHTSHKHPGLTDQDIVNLAMAFIKNEITGNQLSSALKSVGFKPSGSSSVTLLGTRLLYLARSGKVKITISHI